MTRLRRPLPLGFELQRIMTPTESPPADGVGSPSSRHASATSVSHGQGPSKIDGHDLDEVTELREQLWGLQQRQLSQAVIEQAKGILMGHYGICADEAFAILRRWSQDNNIKVRDISAEVVTAASQPSQQGRRAVHSVLRQYSPSAATRGPRTAATVSTR